MHLVAHFRNETLQADTIATIIFQLEFIGTGHCSERVI